MGTEHEQTGSISALVACVCGGTEVTPARLLGARFDNTCTYCPHMYPKQSKQQHPPEARATAVSRQR